MRVKKFVLDANIWVSYLISNQTDILVDIIVANNITVVYCNELTDEVYRVLNYPHLAKRGVSPSEAVKFIKQIGTHKYLVHPIKKYIPGDENDNYVIALALQTSAGFVTSGDKHILSQKEILESKYRKLQIISKVEFEQMFIAK